MSRLDPTTLQLKKKRERPIRAGHPWVFSNALVQSPDLEPGALVRLVSDTAQFLGTGVYNPLTSIRVRILTRDESQTIDPNFFLARFRDLDRKKRRLLGPETTGFRLVHGDADDLPGLIVDVYGDVCVFQIHTAGMDRFRDWIIEALEKAFGFGAIVERSDINVRRREGLGDGPVKVHRGEVTGPVPFQEHGLHFLADTLTGQKTGFYLDQRDARQGITAWAGGRRVLNLFGYTGAFSVYAARAGAASVATVESSAEALDLARRHFELNRLAPPAPGSHRFVRADVFEYVRQQSGKEKFDLVICDPPAFAKTRDKKRPALEAYRRINAACLSLLDRDGILVTSSCSAVLSLEEFRDCVRAASGQAKRDLRVLSTLGQPFDHTDKLSFPEGRYLKTFFLEVL